VARFEGAGGGAKGAIDFDEAVVLRDDAVGDREAEAGAGFAGDEDVTRLGGRLGRSAGIPGR